jgi:hypothetical protein
VKPGDLVFCTSKGIIGSAIRWAQRKDIGEVYAKYNHVAILDREENGEWYVIQAEAAGVTNDKKLTSVAPGGKYRVVALPESVDVDKFLEFARSQVGSAYGYTSILSCAFDLLLPDRICLRKTGTWICSGLAAGALMYAGFKGAQGWPDLYTVTPSQIAYAIALSV